VWNFERGNFPPIIGYLRIRAAAQAEGRVTAGEFLVARFVDANQEKIVSHFNYVRPEPKSNRRHEASIAHHCLDA